MQLYDSPGGPTRSRAASEFAMDAFAPVGDRKKTNVAALRCGSCFRCACHNTRLRPRLRARGTLSVSALPTPKGLFHAFGRMKKGFSLLFWTYFEHEKLQDWSLWHGYSD